MAWRPSASMVVALIALLIALGGAAYAVTALPKNSVHTKQLAKNAVVSSKVKNHTLVGKDLKGGLPIAPRGATGAQGTQGATGPHGATGARGATGNQGPSGSAVAFAGVFADGTLEPHTSSQNVQSVLSTNHPNVYCLTVTTTMTTAVENAVASVDFGAGGSTGFATVEVNQEAGSGLVFFGCPNGTNAIVQTFDSGGNPNPEAFYVGFFG